MGEPQARLETAGEGVLADATHRLNRALRALEAALAGVDAPAPDLTASSAQVVELDAARRRSRELEAAAARASEALGRAAAEVQRVLQDDEVEALEAQASLFDAELLESALESEPGLADDEETRAAHVACEKEPTE